MMRASTVTFVSIGMCVGVILFRLKYEVLGLESTHQQIKKSIYETQEAIHVLKAEWAHLSDPSRIQALSIKYLNNGQPLTFKAVVTEFNKEKKNTNKKEEGSIKNNTEIEAPELSEKDSLDILFEDNSSPTVKNIAFKGKKKSP